MIKYLIWDFNGTILNDLDLSIELLNEMLERQHKKPVSKATYLDIFGFPIKEYYIKAGIDFSVESFESQAVYFIKRYQPSSFLSPLNDQVLETLKLLSEIGIKHILLSASEQVNLEAQIDHFNLREYFIKVLGTNNIHASGKVDRGIDYLNKHKINKADCLYIGDTTHDYEVAKKLGVKVVLYTGGHQSKKVLSACGVPLIDKIDDIISYIK